MTDTLAVVPARGGSTELKRKNLLPVDGVPMFLRSAQAARDAGCHVVVSTDDPEIRSTAIVAGFKVHDRGPELADVPVDHVVSAVCDEPWWLGAVLLVQPTVQPITADILKWFIDAAAERNKPSSMGIAAPHQIWIDGWQTERVNRQDMIEPPWAEVGIRWWPNPWFVGQGATTNMFPANAQPLVDIDTAAHYRSVTTQKRIALWPIADKQHGMGHLRRCLAIAERLQHHDVTFIIDDLDPDSLKLISDRGWATDLYDLEVTTHAAHWLVSLESGYVPPTADLWILDRLDNEDMSHLAGNVVTFEDQSEYQADLRINALYEDGIDWAVIRPEFLAGDYQVRDEVSRIMLLFGGTDPSKLGIQTSMILGRETRYDIDWVEAGDNRAVAEAMHQADILITSAGRTVFEAAAVGIPTIVMAQNLRETTHTHLDLQHGNLYLGLGRLVTDRTLVDSVQLLSNDIQLRTELSQRGRPDGLGLNRIIHAIEGLLGGY